MPVIAVSAIAELEQHRSAWENLSSSASEPNVFFDPWMFIPAFEALRGNEQIHCIFIYDGEDEHGELLGFLPLVFRAPQRRRPFRHSAVWLHMHCFLGTPLLRANRERHAWQIFFDWFQHRRDKRGQALFLNLYGADGPVAAALDEVIKENRFATDRKDNLERAILRSSLPAENYLEAALPRKKRKELKRRQEKLAETGELQESKLVDVAELDAWVAQFLALEQSGWKGEKGSALNVNPEHRAFFAAICRAAFERGLLTMTRLTLTGKPIAMSVNFRSGRTAFAFKIAFDETYRNQSPGILHELEVVRTLLQDQRIDWTDSCADPNHSMINHIWRERRLLSSIAIAAPGSVARFFLPAMSIARRLRRWSRGIRHTTSGGLE